ncbi:MAG: glutamine-hydrolyzing carbamoyl-phosphate synthase small subunit [Clostridia bacterium]
MEKPKRKLVLANGEVFIGDGFGANVDAIGEIVFNTTMGGYQEIVSDPNYADQIIVMSYPLIGNYGITDEDYESKSLMLKALIVHEYNDSPSNFRYTKTLAELLEENNVPGLQGIDTRKLVRIIRNCGSMTAMLVDEAYETEDAIMVMKDYTKPLDGVKKVSCKKRWYSRTPNHKYNVVAVDCGIKFEFIKALNTLGCNVTMVPASIRADEILNLRADGLFLSNGPGNPDSAPDVVELVKALKGKLPIMGVCLGNQIIAKAYGATTYKMPHGHRGANHPVRDLANDLIEIVTENHCYAVDEKSLDGTGLKVTHRDVLDGTVEGVADATNNVFAVQFNPITTAGPKNSVRLFEKFIASMEDYIKLCQKEQI